MGNGRKGKGKGRAKVGGRFDASSVEFHRHSKDYELGVAVLRGFLCSEACTKLKSSSEFGREINDRHDELSFRHQVWRIEQGAQGVPWCTKVLQKLLQRNGVGG